jgi:asparagine synthase (glutamine-hydrolysing)
MCGIAGIIRFSGSEPGRPAVINQFAARIDALLSHRGPDGSGFWQDAHCALVHRRLSIIDPVGGAQPMGNEDGSVQVVFNGEIFNHRELRRELQSYGHRFQSDHSDTEVLVHGWEQFSTHLTEKLLGMFALAVWDQKNKTLFIARDRMGQKPLFYFADSAGVAFASTLPALLAWPGIPNVTTRKLLGEYLTWGYLPPPRTIYRDLQQVEPGRWLCWRNGQISSERYWQPEHKNNAVDQPLRPIITQAVQSQLEADVTMACFLSGGIDSAVIAALMQQSQRQRYGPNIKTVSIGFSETGYDETPLARLTAQRIGSEHHEIRMTPDIGVWDTLKWLVTISLGQPFADSSILPTYYVANASRMIAPCAISGDGGDELFGGYDRYRAMLLMQGYPMAAWLASNVMTRFSASERWIRTKEATQQSGWAAQYAALLQIFSDRQIKRYFPDLPPTTKPADSGLTTHISAVRNTRLLDQRHYLPGDVLYKVDAASMACGMEVRSPFLDHRVVQAANNLPDNQILNRRQGKLPLRRAFADLVPSAVLESPKRGFALPIGEWFRTSLKNALHETLLNPASLCTQISSSVAIAELLQEHASRRRDHTHRLFALLMLELWYTQFKPQII